MNSLAGLYQSLGKPEKAVAIQEEALATCKETLGSDHSDTAMALSNLSALYEGMGEFEKALPLMIESRDIFERTVGHSDPATRQASVYVRQLETKAKATA